MLHIWQDFQLGIVFITHNIDEAIFLADRIIVMSSNPGQIKSEIPIELKHPRSRASAEFGVLYNRIAAELQQ